MDTELMKAVERMDRSGIRGSVDGQMLFDDWHTIKQALRDLEAENALLTYRLETANSYGEQCDDDIRALLDRAEKADALLRDIYVWSDGLPMSINERIQSHLQGAGDEA